jgi:hypothetical protein
MEGSDCVLRIWFSIASRLISCLGIASGIASVQVGESMVVCCCVVNV